MVLLVPVTFSLKVKVKNLFTFHYGSISTIALITTLKIIKQFTFHYGSISTLKVNREFEDIYYLHSTMVLLVPVSFYLMLI